MMKSKDALSKLELAVIEDHCETKLFTSHLHILIVMKRKQRHWYIFKKFSNPISSSFGIYQKDLFCAACVPS